MGIVVRDFQTIYQQDRVPFIVFSAIFANGKVCWIYADLRTSCCIYDRPDQGLIRLHYMRVTAVQALLYARCADVSAKIGGVAVCLSFDRFFVGTVVILLRASSQVATNVFALHRRFCGCDCVFLPCRPWQGSLMHSRQRTDPCAG